MCKSSSMVQNMNDPNVIFKTGNKFNCDTGAQNLALAVFY